MDGTKQLSHNKGITFGMSPNGPYHFDLILSNLLCGINFSYFVSLVHNYIDFRAIFTLQIVLSALFFVPHALFARSYKMTWPDFGRILIVTLLVMGEMYFFLWGAKYTNPIDASTIATLGPAFTLIMASIINHERIQTARIIGIILALIGAWILLYDQGKVLILGSEGSGNLLVLIGVICLAINTVVIKPVLERLGTPVVMGWYYIIGSLIALPFCYKYMLFVNYTELPINAVLELMYVLILGTILPSYLLYKGTEKLTPVHTALYRYIQPVIATIMAVLRGQEKLDRNNLIAAIFIFTGIMLVVAAYKNLFSSKRTNA